MRKGVTEDIVLPDLEDIAKNYNPRNKPWTEQECAIIRKYFGKVPVQALVKSMNEKTGLNRSQDAVIMKARRLGVCGKHE